MTHLIIPHHLSLTAGPVLLNPASIPELNQRLKDWVPPEAAGFFDRLGKRRAKKAKKSKNTGGLPLASQANPRSQNVTVSLAANPAIEEDGPKTLTFAKMYIEGPLISKACYVTTYSGEKVMMIDGYDRIGAQLETFTADKDIDATLVYVNSPGGATSGCFELCEKLRGLNTEKPIIFYTDEMICSAAYAIASCGTEIIGSKTAQIGSIGVAWPRYDATGMNEKDGLLVEITTSGKTKAYGNPDTALDDEERANRQDKVDFLANMFFTDVATTRGLTTEAVQGLEADVFFTQFAIEKGLADHLGDEDFAVSRLTSLLTQPAETPAPTPSPSTAPAAEPTSKQEIPMSRLKMRLAATLSAFAFCMAANMSAKGFDTAALKAAVEQETDDAVENMDDEKVSEMDDEDVAALDEEGDDLEAEEEDKLPPEAEKEEDDTKTAASRIAHKAMARVTSDAAIAAATPAKGEAADPMAVAKAVLALPAAKAQPALAQALAFEDGMTVAKAQTRLAAAASDASAAASPPQAFKAPDHTVAPNAAVTSAPKDFASALKAEQDRRQGKAA